MLMNITKYGYLLGSKLICISLESICNHGIFIVAIIRISHAVIMTSVFGPYSRVTERNK